MDINIFFPINNSIQKNQINTLIIAIIIYVIGGGIIGIILGFMSWIPILGIIIALLNFVVGIYCLIGLILAIIKYVN